VTAYPVLILNTASVFLFYLSGTIFRYNYKDRLSGSYSPKEDGE